MIFAARVAASACLVIAAVPAQQAPAPASVELFASYPDLHGSVPDQIGYLAVLQRRFAAQGLHVHVALTAASAKQLQDTAPPFAVDCVEATVEDAALWLGHCGKLPPWQVGDPDGFADLIAASLCRPPAEARAASIDKLRSYVGRFIDDGPAMPEATARLVELSPLCGFAHACRYIDDLWYRADLPAARADAEKALQLLGGDSWPLVKFCDLALRADAHDRALAAKIAAALQPVLAAEPQAMLARLCWLRAQLRADAGKVAVGDVEAMWPLLEHSSEALLTLAETVAGGGNPERFADLADRALAAAADLEPDPSWLLAAQYEVARRCQRDADAAAHWLDRFVGDKTSPYDLNSAAWSLLIKFETMGRFDGLALALMQRAQQQAGDGLGDAQLDTLALALFDNGHFDEAIAAESKAIDREANDPRYQGRLLRYQRTKAALAPR